MNVVAVLDCLARSLCIYPSEHDHSLIGREQVLYLDTERTVSQLKQFAEQAKNFIRAAVVTCSLIPPSLMPDNVRSEELIPKRSMSPREKASYPLRISAALL